MSFLTYPSGISPSYCIVQTLASFSLSNPIKLSINQLVFLITYPHFAQPKRHYQPQETIPCIIHFAYTYLQNLLQVQNITLTFIFHIIIFILHTFKMTPCIYTCITSLGEFHFSYQNPMSFSISSHFITSLNT